MPMIIKRFLIAFSALALLFIFEPIVTRAQNQSNFESLQESAQTESFEQESFRAVVLQVEQESEEGDNFYQDLRLRGKTGSLKNQEITFPGFTEKISSNHRFKKGDVVFMLTSKAGTSESLLIQDKSRLPSLFWVTIAFVLTTLIVGRMHGLRALLSLLATFVVIIGFVVPRILTGAEPISTVVVSSVVIVVASMVIVYGWTKKSKIAITGMLIGVLLTALISKLFTEYASLTGGAVEEAMFLRDYLKTGIDFQGLLLASFILGSLGVLDDIAITQTSTAQEISETDTSLKPNQIYKKSMKIGVDHIASMINTLFLAYAGASFILLLLFGLNQAPFASFSDVINNELVATEIVRTLVGSIGLILTVPITTYFAAQVYGKKEKKS